MCVVSAVGDFYDDIWKKYGPGPYLPPIDPNILPQQPFFSPLATKEELDQLRKEVAEMKDLLKKAIEIDKKTGQPDCQMEAKLKRLREVVKLVGETIDDILPEKK